MSRDQLHSIASQDAPDNVEVPNTWPGIVVWAVGKFGTGIIFAFMLIYVYQDLQAANKAMVDVVRANTQAIQSLANQTGETNRKIENIERYVSRNP